MMSEVRDAGIHRPRVAVVGDASVDYTVVLPEEPALDEKEFPLWSERALGGTGANAAAVLRSLGSDVTLYATVGDDPDGSWVRAQLEGRGIDAGTVRRRAGRTPFVTIVRRGEARQLIVDVGVGAEPPDLDAEALRLADLIYVSYAPDAVTELVSLGLGSRTVVGVEAWMCARDGFRAALAECGMVIVNEAGWAALGDEGPPLPITALETRGAEGVAVHDAVGEVRRYPAYPARAVDATGAGDCFAATICHFLARGMALEPAMRRALAAAGRSTEVAGAQGWLPTEDAIEELLARR